MTHASSASRIALALSIAAATVSCAGEGSTPPSGMARATILITDAPFPYDSVARVDVYIKRIEASVSGDTAANSTGWVILAEPKRRFNLLDVQQGTTAILGEGELPPGQYRAVRLTLDRDSSNVWPRNSVDASNNVIPGRSAFPVNWQQPGSSEVRINTLVEQPLDIHAGSSEIVLDFDVGRSFLCPGFSCAGFIFAPSVRAVDRAATGTVSGTVRGDTLSGTPTPIANTAVGIYSGNPAQPDSTWSVRATGKTDAQGNFRIAFLLPSTYILRADPPRGSAYLPGVRANVVVTAGTESTNLGIVLPKLAVGSIFLYTNYTSSLKIGQTFSVAATVFTSNGQALQGPLNIVWTTSNPAIMTVGPGPYPNWADVKGTGPGLATLTATYGGVSSSVTFYVYPGTPTDTTTVTNMWVSPLGPIMSVGESVRVFAYGTDAYNQSVPLLAVDWQLSASGVVSMQPDSTCFSTCSVVKLTALAVGTTTIAATHKGLTGATQVTVTPAGQVARIYMSQQKTTAFVGDTVFFFASLFDAKGDTLFRRPITWTSSDTSVMVLNADAITRGVARTKNVGTAWALASSDGKSDSLKLTVQARP